MKEYKNGNGLHSMADHNNHLSTHVDRSGCTDLPLSKVEGPDATPFPSLSAATERESREREETVRGGRIGASPPSIPAAPFPFGPPPLVGIVLGLPTGVKSC